MSDHRENVPGQPNGPIDIHEQPWSSFIGIAMELHARTAAEIASLSTEKLQTKFAETLRNAEATLGREIMDAGIERRINDLPADVILSICAEVLGDDRVKEPLRRIGKIRRDQMEREALLAEIAREAEISWRFDFRKVPMGEIVEVGLFKPDLERFRKSVANADWAGRTITARMVEPESGRMEVVEDITSRNTNFTIEDPCPPLADHAQIRIGVPVPNRSNPYSSELSPIVTHGAVCTLETDRGWHFLKYDIGYVTIGGIVALTAPQQ